MHNCAVTQEQLEKFMSANGELSAKVLRLLHENKELKATLDDWKESHQRTMDEVCDDPSQDDRQHCTCVPDLRERIKSLTDLVEAAQGVMKHHEAMLIRSRQMNGASPPFFSTEWGLIAGRLNETLSNLIESEAK